MAEREQADYSCVPLLSGRKRHKAFGSTDVLRDFRLTDCRLVLWVGGRPVADFAKRPRLTVPLAALSGEDVWLDATPTGPRPCVWYDAVRLGPAAQARLRAARSRWCGGEVAEGRYTPAPGAAELCSPPEPAEPLRGAFQQLSLDERRRGQKGAAVSSRRQRARRSGRGGKARAPGGRARCLREETTAPPAPAWWPGEPRTKHSAAAQPAAH